MPREPAVGNHPQLDDIHRVIVDGSDDATHLAETVARKRHEFEHAAARHAGEVQWLNDEIDCCVDC